ncbi:MAG: DUF4115 domain-containing protein [Pseudomonadota bacterium]
MVPVEQAPVLISDVGMINATVPQPPALQTPVQLVAFNAPSGSDTLPRLDVPQALYNPQFEERDGPISAINPEHIGVFAPVPQKLMPEPDVSMASLQIDAVVDAAPAMPMVQEVSFFTTDDVWISVTDGDGTVVYEQTLRPGERFIVHDT